MNVNELADLITPWCVRVAVTLRIAERLGDANGPTSVDELAALTGCRPTLIHAVLRRLATKGVFDEPEHGVFANNDASNALAGNILFDLDGIGGRMAGAWAGLLTYVRTGKPGYAEVFGLPFWEDIAAHPHIQASFDALMAGHGGVDPNFPLAGGWDDVHHVVDVGGGNGTLLASLLAARPTLRGTLLDLAGAVERSKDVFAAAGAGVEDRVTAIAGSFFDPLPAGADLYVLRGVLHDWDDAEATQILRRCAEAADNDSLAPAVRRPGAGGFLVQALRQVQALQHELHRRRHHTRRLRACRQPHHGLAQ